MKDKEIEQNDELELCDCCGFEYDRSEITVVNSRKYCSCCLDEIGDEL
jgi:hypothetical protein